MRGGQSDENATALPNAMDVLGSQLWVLSVSCRREIGRAAMLVGDGKTDDSAGQPALLQRARTNGLA